MLPELLALRTLTVLPAPRRCRKDESQVLDGISRRSYLINPYNFIILTWNTGPEMTSKGFTGSWTKVTWIDEWYPCASSIQWPRSSPWCCTGAGDLNHSVFVGAVGSWSLFHIIYLIIYILFMFIYINSCIFHLLHSCILSWIFFDIVCSWPTFWYFGYINPEFWALWTNHCLSQTSWQDSCRQTKNCSTALESEQPSCI